MRNVSELSNPPTWFSRSGTLLQWATRLDDFISMTIPREKSLLGLDLSSTLEPC